MGRACQRLFSASKSQNWFATKGGRTELPALWSGLSTYHVYQRECHEAQPQPRSATATAWHRVEEQCDRRHSHRTSSLFAAPVTPAAQRQWNSTPERVSMEQVRVEEDFGSWKNATLTEPLSSERTYCRRTGVRWIRNDYFYDCMPLLTQEKGEQPPPAQHGITTVWTTIDAVLC